MANIVTFTEQFDNGVWSAFDGCVVTADTHAAPAFAGDDAGLADTVEDTSNTVQSSLFGTYAVIPNDSSVWTTSVFIRKDANSARFADIQCQFAGGTGISCGISINTVTGAVANCTDGAPDSSGVIDVDATWWRFWFTRANNNSGNTVLRSAIFPARAATLGGAPLGSIMGSVIAWGMNQTNTGSVQEYEPNPFYSFPDDIWDTLDTLGAAANSYSDTTVVIGTSYDYRILASNAVGGVPSNIATATAESGPMSIDDALIIFRAAS